MREILFRGKRIDNGEWVEGWLVIKKDPVLETTYCFILAYEKGESFVTWYPVKPNTVGQYTGQTDKNGKKIFEWDIIKYGDQMAYINYGFGCFCARRFTPPNAWKNNPGIDIIFNQYLNDIEIIGNLNDNPDLLKGGVDNA